MKTIEVHQPINLKVVRFELDFVTPTTVINSNVGKKHKKIKVPQINFRRKQSIVPSPPPINNVHKKPNVQELIDQLLDELYSGHRDWCSTSEKYYGHGSTSAASLVSSQSTCGEQTDANAIEKSYLEALDISELVQQADELKRRLGVTGERLGRCVRARDRFRRQQKRLCGAFSVLLRHISGDNGARFSVTPGAAGGDGSGEGGYSEWLQAMRLVARLPAGVPHHFRKKLWLTLADRYLNARGIDWSVAERACFRGTSQPDDAELGAQILKDLHRTGCSLFCGTEGRENQAMLRRVLLAYARWNKEVGYCQGFNMLAAIILEVMEKSEAESLKVMIYLVEAVLPEGYFADDLRGLSADMAAFRDLLRLRLPRLANHMDHLQRISDGGGVEPPLPDVFTMQWFLTLYATWLPRESLLRIWDLVLLDGNEVLLLTALAIWDMLQDRILSARSADEYYSCMGGGAGAIWEAGEALVARVVTLDSAPELPRLRNLHRYRVTPPEPPAPVTQPPFYQPPLHTAMQTMTKRGLRLFYSEDEGDSSDDGNKMALATVVPRRDERFGASDRLSLDIGALKRQYLRLRERQRQAHVILAAACARHAAVGVSTSPTSLTVNNLLLGKSAIVSSRGRRLGPPPGAVPPSRQSVSTHSKTQSRTRARSNDTISWKDEKNKKSLNRRNSLKWKDIKRDKNPDLGRKASIDFDETGDGIIVSENEANEMIATLRSRSSSESSTYSSHSASSTDTSLCDENEKASDSETDLPIEENKQKGHSHLKKGGLPSTSKARDIQTKSNNVADNITSNLHQTDVTMPTNINDYIESAAGESLRTYIDEFHHKSKDNMDCNDVDTSILSSSLFKEIGDSEHTDRKINSKSNENISIIETPKLDYKHKNKTTPLYRGSKNFMDLSPIEISPCRFTCHKSYDLCSSSYNFESKFRPPPPTHKTTSRAPDIIDSLTRYPNFSHDINLSEKNISDFDSPPRSPGAESIVVSEDEPPIPLKIDKYFEHSPEFFGARITITDPNNPNVPNRRAVKRQSRMPKKPDSLTLQSSYNEKLIKSKSERASSLPQSHNYYKNVVAETDVETKGTFDIKDELNINYKFLYQENKINTKYEKAKSISKDISPQRESPINVCFEKELNDEVFLEGHEIETDTFKFKETYIADKQASDENDSPKEFALTSGRKNSERALQIIQENSKILSRILTKQNLTETSTTIDKSQERYDLEILKEEARPYSNISPAKCSEIDITDSPLIRESTSDSVIVYNKDLCRQDVENDKSDFFRNRPISLDDPLSLELKSIQVKSNDLKGTVVKSPSTESLINKTDLYGWENKGFLAKCEYQNFLGKTDDESNFEFANKTEALGNQEISVSDIKPTTSTDWAKTHDSFSADMKSSIVIQSSEPQDTSTYERRCTPDESNYPFSNKYNDFILSRASDICSKTVDLEPKVCENLSKTDNSQVSEFTQVVTSSISFTYDPSIDDDSPTGAKSNSSDTLCQITSLDQVSTPISPKIFPNRDTPGFPKELTEMSDRVKIESDDSCSAITSLIETDTLSSLSYPRSPSTGSYHPFPARPAIRMPKELGIRLGMYPRDSINSPSK